MGTHTSSASWPQASDRGRYCRWVKKRFIVSILLQLPRYDCFWCRSWHRRGALPLLLLRCSFADACPSNIAVCRGQIAAAIPGALTQNLQRGYVASEWRTLLLRLHCSAARILSRSPHQTWRLEKLRVRWRWTVTYRFVFELNLSAILNKRQSQGRHGFKPKTRIWSKKWWTWGTIVSFRLLCASAYHYRFMSDLFTSVVVTVLSLGTRPGDFSDSPCGIKTC